MTRLLIEHVLPRAVVQSWNLPRALVKETQKIVRSFNWSSVRLFRRFFLGHRFTHFFFNVVFIRRHRRRLSRSTSGPHSPARASSFGRCFEPFPLRVSSRTRAVSDVLSRHRPPRSIVQFSNVPTRALTLRSRALRSPVARFKSLLFHSFARAGWRRLAGVTRSYPRHQCDSVNLIPYRMIECVPKTRT